MKKINIREFIKDLNEIKERIWEVDIPHPTVPEYREHHEQMQKLMAYVDAKIKDWREVIGE